MIVPSIDLEGGRSVQLVGGEELALDAGDPLPLLERFGRVGEVAVIDLDAAKGTGTNDALVEDLCRRGRVRVGGGIRDEATARRWLDAGAARVILGTAAEPALLRRLPKERVQVALDARDGEVVVAGWREATGRRLLERVAALRELCGSFLVTFVEREGRLGGTDLDLARAVVAAADGTPVTIAGGVTTATEVAELDRMGADCQVGMALYTGRLGLAEAFAAPLVSDRPDGLWPTVVVDERGVALGLAWSSASSLAAALEQGRGIYHSRKRGPWTKGATSGATQELLAVDADCDRDALRFTVRQSPPGFCHRDQRTCWGSDRGLGRLERRLAARLSERPGPRAAASHTRRLASDPALLGAKLREEAAELASARTPSGVAHEAADVLYFALVRAVAAGVPLEAIEAELARRELVTTRRPCEAKPEIP